MIRRLLDDLLARLDGLHDPLFVLGGEEWLIL